MFPGRCNTGLTAPRHAEYQIIHLILGNITPLSKQCPPMFRYTGGRRLTGVIHKQKFSTHGALKQTYMLFQNDIPIDEAGYRYILNMQVSSGNKNISSSNQPSWTTVTVSSNGVSWW
ncbi:uncharacterized protein TNCV_272381 [Trichonephila clavipes]|nr:uncharacterized protein TNCV_272381 [Trichonephila clavipes]